VGGREGGIGREGRSKTSQNWEPPHSRQRALRLLWGILFCVLIELTFPTPVSHVFSSAFVNHRPLPSNLTSGGESGTIEGQRRCLFLMARPDDARRDVSTVSQPNSTNFCCENSVDCARLARRGVCRGNARRGRPASASRAPRPALSSG
jgi:hypothetical protein